MSSLALLAGIKAAGAIWGGIVLKALWAWFVVPTFGLPDLSLRVAIGVGLVASFLTHQYVPTKDEDLPQAIIHEFFYPLIALVMGLVVRLFV